MRSGGDQSPPPPPPAPAAAASDEEEDDDGAAEDAAQPVQSPASQTQQRFDELCSRLNMDEAARAEAWDSYRSMSESYTLEVRSGGGDEGFFGPSGGCPPREWGPSPRVGLSCRSPPASTSGSPALKGLGIIRAHVSPGNLAFEKLLAALRVNRVAPLFPFVSRMGDISCPKKAPRG